jgi:hypothetical protein
MEIGGNNGQNNTGFGQGFNEQHQYQNRPQGQPQPQQNNNNFGQNKGQPLSGGTYNPQYNYNTQQGQGYSNPQYGQPQNQQYNQPYNQNQMGGYNNQQFNNYTNGTSNTLAIVSLVCGILALVCCCCPFPFSLAAIICGVIVLANHKPGKTMAIVGTILGIAGVILFIILQVNGKNTVIVDDGKVKFNTQYFDDSYNDIEDDNTITMDNYEITLDSDDVA